MNGEQIKGVLQLCEEQGYEARVVIEDPRQPRMALGVVGVPRYVGFDIDRGEWFEIGDKQLLVHNIERVEFINDDYWRRRESVGAGAASKEKHDAQ